MIFNKYELNKLVGCKHLSKSETYKYYTSPITENSGREISSSKIEEEEKQQEIEEGAVEGSWGKEQ